MRSAPLALAALAATITLSTGAFPGATPRHPTTASAMTLGPAAMRFGRSLGSPTEGHLVGGMHLDETAYIRVVPADAAGDVRWGLEPLVTMLDRVARAVRRQFPDAITSVGHLSREGGGEVERHRSHESGRDADVGFFIRNADGRQLLPSHFVSFRPDGEAVGWAGAHFDDAKNWALIAALIDDPQAHVTHIFVATPLRARLLAHAERAGIPATLRMRAAEIMQQPRGALPHDDHFHVRIGCPGRMSGCVENPTVRVRAPSMMAANGRHGRSPRGLVTAAPKRETRASGSADGRTVTPSLPASMNPPPFPAAEPRADSPGKDDAPPALMTSPIDDVDG